MPRFWSRTFPVLSLLLATPPLANARLYLVRHAEKPEDGSGLTAAGTARAAAYVGYFRRDPLDGSTLRLTHLFAATDSKKSVRPRLTLEPLAKATHGTLDQRFTDKDPAAFVVDLRSHDYGNRILVAWRHGQIPALLTALGADPARFVPEGKWPDGVYDRVVELWFDARGNLDLAHSRTVAERLMPGDELAIPISGAAKG